MIGLVFSRKAGGLLATSRKGPVIYILSFIIYVAAVYAFKRATYPRPWVSTCAFFPDKKNISILMIFLSSDYWVANHFKNRIRQLEYSPTRQIVLKKYIVESNRLNVLLSAIVLFTLIILHSKSDQIVFYTAMSCIAFLRYVSRSYEIAYAFGRDVFQSSKNESGLLKNERISLAIWSYFEIFLYSAAAYLAVFDDISPLKAIVASLSIGTFINGGVLDNQRESTTFGIIIFIQVLCTLSLVILSLAAYLSRENDA